MSDQAPDSSPIEDLTTADEASTFQEVVGMVRERRRSLDSMPDGPRPRGDTTYKRKKIFVDWHLQVSYIGAYLATVTRRPFARLRYIHTTIERTKQASKRVREARAVAS